MLLLWAEQPGILHEFSHWGNMQLINHRTGPDCGRSTVAACKTTLITVCSNSLPGTCDFDCAMLLCPSNLVLWVPYPSFACPKFVTQASGGFLTVLCLNQVLLSLFWLGAKCLFPSCIPYLMCRQCTVGFGMVFMAHGYTFCPESTRLGANWLGFANQISDPVLCHQGI